MARQTSAQGWPGFQAQLKATSAAIGLLVVLPGLALCLFPRPRALGLERLLGQSSLLQSFPVRARQPTPPLWQQFLGADLANQAWSRPGLWWQFWAEHGNGQPFLALPWAALPITAQRQLPPNSLRVDDLLVVAPDPLSQKLLGEELQIKQRQGRGLDQRCLTRLKQGQAVYWSPAGLGALLGPVAPLMQRFQQGCLSLELRGEQLLFDGESTASEGFVLDGWSPPLASSINEPLDPKVLLELRGPALGVLLDGLVARQLVRQPLQERYGLDDRELALIRHTPFALQLVPMAKGPFQAGLQLHLAVSKQRRSWTPILQGLRQSLSAQGLGDGNPAPGQPFPGTTPTAIGSSALAAAQWRNPEGLVLGGWRWVSEPGAEPELLVFLGPDPGGPDPGGPDPGGRSQVGQRQNRGLILPGPGSQTELRLRPAALGQLKLFPPDLPGAVQRSIQLDLAAAGAPNQPLSQLMGRLRWDRLR